MNYKDDMEQIVSIYPELLRWRHLVEILGYSRRSLERWVKDGKLAGVEFVDITGDGNLMATKASVLRFLQSRKIDLAEKKYRPALKVIS